MSAAQTPGTAGGSGGNDPSMEDILASIRRILSEEEPAGAPGPAAAPAAATAPATGAEQPPAGGRPDDVLVLDQSMMVPEEAEAAAPPPPPPPPPPPLPLPLTAEPALVYTPPEVLPPPRLLAPETEAAATTSVGTLMRTLASERTFQVHRGGPTIEDVVREELRPLLKQWLDANLPDMVERLVRAEIERVVGRAVP